MVEAAGVEPAPSQNANWLMARDFRRNLLEIRCLVANSLCSGVLRSAPQSWRHVGDGVANATVTPSSFEVKADIRGYADVARGRQPLEPDPEGASASGQVGAPPTCGADVGAGARSCSPGLFGPPAQRSLRATNICSYSPFFSAQRRALARWARISPLAGIGSPSIRTTSAT